MALQAFLYEASHTNLSASTVVYVLLRIIIHKLFMIGFINKIELLTKKELKKKVIIIVVF